MGGVKVEQDGRTVQNFGEAFDALMEHVFECKNGRLLDDTGIYEDVAKFHMLVSEYALLGANRMEMLLMMQLFYANYASVIATFSGDNAHIQRLAAEFTGHAVSTATAFLSKIPEKDPTIV